MYLRVKRQIILVYRLRSSGSKYPQNLFEDTEKGSYYSRSPHPKLYRGLNSPNFSVRLVWILMYLARFHVCSKRWKSNFQFLYFLNESSRARFRYSTFILLTHHIALFHTFSGLHEEETKINLTSIIVKVFTPVVSCGLYWWPSKN